MPKPTPAHIRRIFLGRRPDLALSTAAGLLGMSLKELKRDIDEGVIVATSTDLGVRIGREEMVGAARRLWEATVIEDALADDAASVLPAAVRLVVLHVRVPRYHVETVVGVARRLGVSVDEVVSRELEDLACAHSEELTEAVPSVAVGLGIGDGRRGRKR